MSQRRGWAVATVWKKEGHMAVRKIRSRRACWRVPPGATPQPRAARARDFALAFFRALLAACGGLLGSLPREVLRYARKARFTLAPSEKASATSGSSKTKVVPAVARA